jgi:hypothetical protein
MSISIFETEKLWHFFERGTAIKLRRMTTRCRLCVAESSIFEILKLRKMATKCRLIRRQI